MKRPSTLIVTMLLGATLAFAQTGGDKATSPRKLNPQPLPPGAKVSTTNTASTTTGKKAHKGGKKGKKSSGGSTTPPPK